MSGCPPVLADEREQPMFDLVPLAGAGGNDRLKSPARFRRPVSVIPISTASPCAVAAAGIGRNQQVFRLWIAARAHPAPPAANALDAKVAVS